MKLKDNQKSDVMPLEGIFDDAGFLRKKNVGPTENSEFNIIAYQRISSFDQRGSTWTFTNDENINGGGSETKSSPGTIFQPRGSIEVPYSFLDGKLLRQQNLRGDISCNIANGRWKSRLFGSSLIRGPIGACTGTIHLSYDALSRQNNLFRGVSQFAVGDQSHMMAGLTHHRATSWYGFGILYDPSFRTTNGSTRFRIQTGQLSTNFGQLAFSIDGPTSAEVSQLNASISLRPKKESIYDNRAPLLDYCIQLGLQKMSHLQLDISIILRFFKYRNLKLNGSFRSITSGLQLDADLLQIASNSSSSVFGIGIRHHNQIGLSWVFTWIQGEMTIKIPIFVLKKNTKIIPIQNYICSSIYLGLLSFLFQEVLDEVWNLSSKEEENDPNTSKEHTDRSKARSNAEKQRQLMMKQASSRQKIEMEKQGLVIIKAIYYIMDGDSWDVTIQLQFWTTKSSLDLPALPKQNLLGFYDVRCHKEKRGGGSWWCKYSDYLFSSNQKKVMASQQEDPLLAVRYNYGGLLYELVIKNDEPLSLPSNQARVVLKQEMSDKKSRNIIVNGTDDGQ